MALRSCQAKPLHGFGEILRQRIANGITSAHGVLSVSFALLGGLAAPFYSLGTLRGSAFACDVELGQCALG